MIKINYPGTGNNTQFTYDSYGKIVSIAETSGSSVLSTKNFIWSELSMREVRNGSGSVTSQYFDFGQTIAGSDYFYTKDHIGSIRELESSTGSISAQYLYDPFGRVAKINGTMASDFLYAGYYAHASSNLNLTLTRAYSSLLGRFLNRDFLAEEAGTNLFEYTNSPTCFVDPLGTDKNLSPISFGGYMPYDHVVESIQNAGCRGVVDSALGLSGPQYGWNLPERSGLPSTCYWGNGNNPDPAAKKLHCNPPHCPPNTHLVIWCKQGNFATEGSPGSPAGLGDMSTSGENYNYSVWTTKGYQGANSPNSYGGQKTYLNEPQPIEGGNFHNSICCGTCAGNRGR